MGRVAYRGRWFIRVREFICGDHLEADIYPVFQQPGKRREKCRPTSEIKKKQNQRDREKRLMRILRMNFTKKDYAVHLTYGTLPENLDEAKRLLKNYLDRLRRLYKKAGLEFRYLYTTEYGRKSGRIHHHLILSGGLDRSKIEDVWGHGYANCDRLQFEDGLEALAKYMTKGAATYRAWTPSRNLVMPEPKVRDGAITIEELSRILEAIDGKNARNVFEQMYPGYECTENPACEKNDVNGGVYIRASLRKRESGQSPSLLRRQPPTCLPCVRGGVPKGRRGCTASTADNPPACSADSPLYTRGPIKGAFGRCGEGGA